MILVNGKWKLGEHKVKVSCKTRVVNSEDSNFPVSEVHNRPRNRIANILKIIG